MLFNEAVEHSKSGIVIFLLFCPIYLSTLKTTPAEKANIDLKLEGNKLLELIKKAKQNENNTAP